MQKVYEFDPVLYPTRLWVVVKPDVREMDAEFYALDEYGETLDEMNKDLFDDSHTVAQTTLVQDKTSEYKGCLVAILRPKEVTPGIAAHEASHCADYLCDSFGIKSDTFETGESRAYYVQWVADTIWDVLHNPAKCKSHLKNK